MDTWQPISAEELGTILAAQIGNCSPEQKELFERCKVIPYLVPINRLGNAEAVFVVAKLGDIVLYYEDVEEGFNVSPLSSEGSITTPSYEQWELGHALGYLAAA